MKKKTNFFISYATKDEAWAVWVAWIIEAAGYSTRIQAWDFCVGSNFVLEMDEAIRESDKIILILSPTFLNSNYTQSEWASFFVKDPNGQTRTIIPIKVEQCSIDGLLRTIVHLDIVGFTENNAKDAIMNIISECQNDIKRRLKPQRKPRFPSKKPLCPLSRETNQDLLFNSDNLQLTKIKPKNPTNCAAEECICNSFGKFYQIKYVETSLELEELWNIDTTAYGVTGIDLPTFYKWWSQYEKSLYITCDNQKIIGAFGLYPLTKSQGQKIKLRSISEKELLPAHLSYIIANKISYWYAGGIVLLPEYQGMRKDNPIKLLLNIGLTLWIESGCLKYPIEVFAMPINESGENLLIKFGFIKIRQDFSKIDKFPLYSIKFSDKSDILSIKNRILKIQ